jgi:hypothetical protein
MAREYRAIETHSFLYRAFPAFAMGYKRLRLACGPFVDAVATSD